MGVRPQEICARAANRRGNPRQPDLFNSDDRPERVRHYMKMADEGIDRMLKRLQVSENRQAPS
jgi:hypothetical protein